MALIVEAEERTDRDEDRTDRNEERTRHEYRSTADRPRQRKRIDVSDVHTARIGEFVRSNVETDSVSLEHRGGRTYLVLED